MRHEIPPRVDCSLPTFAAWQHREASEGFEVVFFSSGGRGLHAEGSTAAVEQGEPFVVGYSITLDEQWRTRSARLTGRSLAGAQELTVEADGQGHWIVGGERAPQLDGCLDLDLESSALTNAFPMNRLALEPGQVAEAPAAYVRALDLRVERLEQRYRRLDDMGGEQRFDYESPAFGFRCELLYAEDGLVLDYPGIARRVAR